MVLLKEGWFSRLIQVLRLFFYRMAKRVRRFVSGQTEVARICGDGRQVEGRVVEHSVTMTTALWKEWSTSRKLHQLFADHAKDPGMEVDETAKLICGTKNIVDGPLVTENLKKCLEDIKGVNKFIAKVKAKSLESFDAKNSAHEEKLEELWQTLLPGSEREGGRYSRAWGRIGFQQSDPVSDFRGGGMLGLEQLVYLAKTRTSVARRMIKEPLTESKRYPWACVGINLTMEAKRILEERKIDVQLYGKSSSEAMVIFNELYADMFEILHARWLAAKPENVLAFPPVFKETIEAIDKEVGKNGSLVPPGAEG